MLYMKDQELTRIEGILWRDGSSRDVWMIVDGARTVEVFRTLLDCHLEYACLYSGPLAPDLEIAAPYLVQLDYDYRDTRRLIRRAWGNSWGVFLRSGTSLDKLRHHLKKFLLVRDQRGRRLVFRFYDPRVLRVYLPTCTPDELRTVYGPIDSFCTEDEAPGALLEFGFDQERLLERRFPLSPSATDPKPLPSSPSRPSNSPTGAVRPLPLTIRAEQLDEYSRREVRKFEDWVGEHLRKFFPQQCEAAGDPEVRRLIRDGIRRAAGYRITSQRDVCKFIDLTMLAGENFESDPRLPWALEILERPTDSASRITALTDYAEDMLRRG